MRRAESFAGELSDSLGRTREEINAMISKGLFLKCTPLLTEVGNIAALMASD